jgi:hypothetical protein
MRTDFVVPSSPVRGAKRVLAGIVFAVMGRGLVTCCRIDQRVRKEVASWPEGTVVTLEIAPDGPSTTVRLEEGRLTALGGGRPVPATLLVTFKNVNGAFPVLLGMKSVLQSFVEHRASLAGDVGLGISLVRCLHIVEGYLFPDIMTRRILPEPALRYVSHIRAYAGLLASTAELNPEGVRS